MLVLSALGMLTPFCYWEHCQKGIQANMLLLNPVSAYSVVCLSGTAETKILSEKTILLVIPISVQQVKFVFDLKVSVFALW